MTAGRPVYSDLPTEAEVVVVGAGIIGLAVALELSRRGRGVVVVDAGLPGSGTSSRGEGNLLVSDKVIPAEAALALRSLALWRELAVAAPLDVEYEEKGGIVTAATRDALATLLARAEEQRSLGIHSERLGPAELQDAEPALSPALAGGVLYRDDAQVQPILATRALLEMCRSQRVQVVPRCEVLGGRPEAGGLAMDTSAGPIRADTVVCAAGPWSGAVASRLGGSAAVFPRRGLLLVTEPLPPGTIRHKVYDGGYVDTVTTDEATAHTATVLEATRGGTVLIGSTRESVGWDTTLPWHLAGSLARSATAMMPMLEHVSVIRAYQGFRPATPDHLPLIGPDGRIPGLFHAGGHEGAGIGLAPATAELVADLMEEPAPTAFDPARVDASAGSHVHTAPITPTLQALTHRDGPAAPDGTRLASHLNRSMGEGWRHSRFDTGKRGLFCGIGDCHECLVVVGGRTVRSCLVGEAAPFRPHAPEAVGR